MQDLEFNLKPSTYYCLGLLLFCAASMSIVFMLAITIWIKIFLWLIIFIQVSFIFQRYGILRSAYSIKALRLLANGNWLCQTSASFYEATLLGSSTLTMWFAVLRLRKLGTRYSKTCLVFRDSLSKEKFRQLLIVVRTQR